MNIKIYFGTKRWENFQGKASGEHITIHILAKIWEIALHLPPTCGHRISIYVVIIVIWTFYCKNCLSDRSRVNNLTPLYFNIVSCIVSQIL